MKYLLWDFDGTLGYRTGGWSQAFVEVSRRADTVQDVEVEDVRPHLQEDFPWHTPDHPHTDITTADQWWEELYPLFERVFEENGVDPARTRELAEMVRTTYVHQEWGCFDDTIPALSSLSEVGWNHIVLSNHVPELAVILRELQLRDHFDEVYTSADIGYEKPHPAAFRTVLDALGEDATVWMIGDSVRADVNGASAVGLPAILVRDTHPNVAYTRRDLSTISRVLDD